MTMIMKKQQQQQQKKKMMKTTYVSTGVILLYCICRVCLDHYPILFNNIYTILLTKSITPFSNSKSNKQKQEDKRIDVRYCFVIVIMIITKKIRIVLRYCGHDKRQQQKQQLHAYNNNNSVSNTQRYGMQKNTIQ